MGIDVESVSNVRSSSISLICKISLFKIMKISKEQIDEMEKEFPECIECEGEGRTWDEEECPICGGLGYVKSSNEN